ncbi:MAG: hypothetical protein PHD41_04620 [Methanosarcinaceae archaeon]|nr:hypothetical protein [Methanosarcinaceae archaeon]
MKNIIFYESPTGNTKTRVEESKDTLLKYKNGVKPPKIINLQSTALPNEKKFIKEMRISRL